MSDTTEGWSHDLAAVPVYVSRYCVKLEQVRFPRSRKKRIRRKWNRRSSNWAEVPFMVCLSGRIYCHPALVPRLRRSSH